MYRLFYVSILATSELDTDFLVLSPGRFFVSHEMKMFIAHMVMNYDVEPLAKRPENTWFGPTVLPDMKASIRVRRRAGTVS